MLECLKKKLKMLNKTKESWEETKTYIQVTVFEYHTWKLKQVHPVIH